MSLSTLVSDRAAGSRHWLFVVVLTLLASTRVAHLQAPDVSQPDQYRTLDQALARLKMDGSVPTADLEQRLAELRNTRGGPCRLDTLCARLWQLITERAGKSSLRSAVRIETTRGVGASVRYQTIAERLTKGDAHEMKQLTPTTESLPIGSYYIWSVRDTRATSPVDRTADFTMTSESITLVEK
jgi:hypothetical protein